MNKQTDYLIAFCVYGGLLFAALTGQGCATTRSHDQPINLKVDPRTCFYTARVDQVSRDVLEVHNTSLCDLNFKKAVFVDTSSKEYVWHNVGLSQVIRPGQRIDLVVPDNSKFAMAVMATPAYVQVHLNGKFD